MKYLIPTLVLTDQFTLKSNMGHTFSCKKINNLLLSRWRFGVSVFCRVYIYCSLGSIAEMAAVQTLPGV